MKCGLEHGMFFSINTHNSSSEEIKKRNDNVVDAKITIYAESDEQYTTFITKEAYQAIDHWIDYHRKCGEQISDERLACQKFMGCDYTIRCCKRACNSSKKTIEYRCKKFN